MKKRNISSPKDNNSPIIEPKGIELCDLANKKSKVPVSKKVNNLQESTETWFNEIRKSTCEPNETFTKGTEIIKKNQTEILGSNFLDMTPKNKWQKQKSTSCTTSN